MKDSLDIKAKVQIKTIERWLVVSSCWNPVAATQKLGHAYLIIPIRQVDESSRGWFCREQLERVGECELDQVFRSLRSLLSSWTKQRNHKFIQSLHKSCITDAHRQRTLVKSTGLQDEPSGLKAKAAAGRMRNQDPTCGRRTSHYQQHVRRKKCICLCLCFLSLALTKYPLLV
jgi:hypothetical protein